MEAIWTLDGDETSWSSWALNMAKAPASPLMQDSIAAHRASRPGWALDVGCGTGRAFTPLVEAGYRVIGLDPNRDAIRLSRIRVGDAHLAAYPILASAAELPLRSGSVPFVLAISSLFHLSPRETASALQEIRRVLVPAGKALLHFLDLEDWRHNLAPQIHPEQAPARGYRAVVTCFCSQAQIETWIAEAGLKPVQMELKTSSSQGGQQRNWLVLCHK
jgi:SAM-dependent methyltransferase